jgi:tetratricopeptide (TPR) repeat protein
MGSAALIELGERDKALDWTRRAESMDPDDPSVLYNVACDYAMLDMRDEGVRTLTRAIDNGFGHWKWIEHDSTLDNLRAEAGFAALLARKPGETAAQA